MIVEWRPPEPEFRGFIAGMVERCDDRQLGLSLEFPAARPLLHVTLGADYCFAQAGGFVPMPRAALWEPNDATRVTRPAGPIHAFVVALTFKGLEALAPGTSSKAIGGRIDLAEMLGDAGHRLSRDLQGASDFQERCQIVQRLWREGATPMSEGSAAWTYDIADAIVGGSLKGSVASICERNDVSERTLLNRFRSNVGMSPKKLLRIARLNRAMRSLTPDGWGEPLHDDVRLEYFDDAHYSNEFRAFTGLSPHDFRKRKSIHSGKLVYSLPVARANGQ